MHQFLALCAICAWPSQSLRHRPCNYAPKNSEPFKAQTLSRWPTECVPVESENCSTKEALHEKEHRLVCKRTKWRFKIWASRQRYTRTSVEFTRYRISLKLYIKMSIKWKNLCCRFSCIDKQVSITGVFTKNSKWIWYIVFELLTLKVWNG